MRIGLIDFDSLLVNVAIMKLSTYHKAKGDTVLLYDRTNPFPASAVDKVYVSVIFDWNRAEAAKLATVYPNAVFGGSGWDLTTTLPAEIEGLRPDYDLYTQPQIAGRIRGQMTDTRRQAKALEIVDSGIGFLSRGCVRHCAFCVVPKKEGSLHRVANIPELLNPRSNKLVLLDNSLTANPDCVDILTEIKARKLVVDICQGIDVRMMTPEIAQALKGVKMMRSLHYAWDLMPFEKAVLQGIDVLSQQVKKWRHMCFTLVNFNTTWEEDYYRFHKLAIELDVDPYVMYFNKHKLDKTDPKQVKLLHFQRWVNRRAYKIQPDFNQYDRWVNAQAKLAA
jgi:hypothetical protein